MSSEDAPSANPADPSQRETFPGTGEDAAHAASGGWCWSEENTVGSSGKQQRSWQSSTSPPSSICTIPSTAAVYRERDGLGPSSDEDDDEDDDNGEEGSLDSRQNNDKESPSVSDDDTLPSRASFASLHEQEMISLPRRTTRTTTPQREKGSERKRSRRSQLSDDAAIDDILGQITSRMTHLSTSDQSTSCDQSIVAAFIEVLQCSPSEAEFFLESSAWDMQTAVLLYLENNPHSLSQFEREREMNSRVENSSNNNNSNNNLYNPLFGNGHCSANHDNGNNQGTMSASSSFTYPRNMRPVQKRWRRREVAIQDLPTDWEARVSAYEGVVYFVHRPSGRTQKTVPPGFADLDPLSSSAMSSSENESPRATDTHSQQQHTMTNSANMFFSSNTVHDTDNNEQNWASSSMMTGPSPPSLSPAAQPTSFCTAMEESEMVEDYDALAKLWGRKEDGSEPERMRTDGRP